MSDIETIRQTVNAIDLGLSTYGADVDITGEDSSEYADGVLDGFKMGIFAFDDPDLTPNEVIARVIESNEYFGDKARVLGMLAGSLASIRLLKNPEEK